MTAVLEKRISVEQYLELEKASEERHEYVDGQLRLMAGESIDHEQIILNLVEKLRPIARAKGCRFLTKTIKAKVRGSKYRYPDVMIVCTPRLDKYIEDSPCFLLEVVSPNSDSVDRGEKLEEYTKLESVQRYVLLEQNRIFATVYWREENSWLVDFLESHDWLQVPCLETRVRLSELYNEVEF